ncbi:DNA topology modulation protein [Streptococcus cuniculipharyngis]|uniref:DNA topology modulation protein n=1 Tax=Streptococcus cuniculipharyngis TaxID=1562651 RepID=A0A5C5SA06_9STRE|nr:DNA topology modulation protein [Streptococcus cuniculipharyngis]TWS96933.1 DNA topology modulation protein [Streptococcus cuniculipharyngis]
MKIAIIGYSGSGKSSLARQLGQHDAIPVTHLDRLHFLPNWQERSCSDFRQLVKPILQEDDWLIEGNYSETYYQERLAQADIIIMLLFPAYRTYYRVLKRYLSYKGKTRPDMADGCLEKLDWAFTKWIWWDGRNQKHKANYQHIAQTYGDKVLILNSQKAIDGYLSQLTSG